MADPRFYRRAGPFPLGAIAEAIGAVLKDPAFASIPIDDVAALEAAGPGDLTLFSDPRHVGAVAETRAAAVLTTLPLSAHANGRAGLLFAKDARLAFAKAGHLFYPAEAVEPAIDPLARVDPRATIGPGCRIEAGASIAAGAEIGARCHIGANVVVGSGVVIGPDCRIGANTTIGYALIGARVEIGSCCSIGGPGFGFVPGPSGLLRMPQLGRVIVEDGVRIDANCAIDRGASGDTVIGAGTAIDNLVQIAHNVRIGRHCAIAGQAGIAGSTVIGDGVLIGGQVAVSDHLTVGSGARIAGKSGVSRDVEPGASVGGYPAVPIRQWHRQTAALKRLLDRPHAAAEPGAAPAAAGAPGDGIDRR